VLVSVATVWVASLRELGPPTPVVSLELLHGRLELRLILGTCDAQPLSKGAQPGADFVEALEARDIDVYYMESPNGDRATISIWENKQAMEQGGIKANAAPLLSCQRGEDIPSPSRVEIWEVLDQFVAAAAVRA